MRFVPSHTLGALAPPLALAALAVPLCHAEAPALPAVGLAYTIEARLEPSTRALTGSETVRWTNGTGAPVATLDLHLYLNAFSSEGSTWIREAGESRDGRSAIDRYPDPWGWMEPKAILQSGQAATWHAIAPDDGNPLDRTLVEVALPKPVGPGETLELKIDFEGRMPVPFARTGCTADFCLVGQWFPKLGVIEAPGVRHATAQRRAAHQFHGATEFYADFADFDVTLDTPAGWLVAATGRAAAPPAVANGRQRVRYVQRAVHDFAWVAGSKLAERVVPHQVPDGPRVDVHYVVPRGVEHQFARMQRATEGALDTFSREVGTYPYDVATVVCPPWNAGATAGMEYPTFVTGAMGDPLFDRFPAKGLLLPEQTIVHELGHEWFYGLLASNETEEAYLDEGFNSYFEQVGMEAIYGASGPDMGRVLGYPLFSRDWQEMGAEAGSASIKDALGTRPTWLYAPHTAFLQVYPRTAVTLTTAERRFGRDAVRRVFREYFRRFAFRHPDLDDFLGVAGDVGGADLAAYLREAFSRRHEPNYAVDKLTVAPWKAPLGRVRAGEGAPTVITKKNRGEQKMVGLDPAALEKDGRVTIEIDAPGWVRTCADGRTERTDGRTLRSAVAPERGAADPGFKPAKDAFFESGARLSGPGWDTIPVDVVFRFADGATVRDRWDGRATWRAYRFLRAAPLVQVSIDPRHEIAVDVKPQDNGRRRDADARTGSTWGGWITTLAGFVGAGVAQWF